MTKPNEPPVALKDFLRKIMTDCGGDAYKDYDPSTEVEQIMEIVGAQAALDRLVEKMEAAVVTAVRDGMISEYIPAGKVIAIVREDYGSVASALDSSSASDAASAGRDDNPSAPTNFTLAEPQNKEKPSSLFKDAAPSAYPLSVERTGEAYMEGFSDGLSVMGIEFSDYQKEAEACWKVASCRQEAAQVSEISDTGSDAGMAGSVPLELSGGEQTGPVALPVSAGGTREGNARCGWFGDPPDAASGEDQHRMPDGRPIFGEDSPHDIGDHLAAVCAYQPVSLKKCRIACRKAAKQLTVQRAF